MKLIKATTKCEVDAVRDCIDLIDNGYIVLFSCSVPNGTFIRLRHRKSARILSLLIYPQRYLLRENGKVLKEVFY